MPRPGDTIWLRAYRRLNTHRQLSREFACPIPWDVIAAYGDRLGFVDIQHDAFVDTMMLIDQKHREWHRDQQDKESKREARRQRRQQAGAGGTTRG